MSKLLITIITLATSIVNGSQTPLPAFAKIIKTQQGTLTSGKLHVHSQRILKIIKDTYSSEDLERFTELLKVPTEIKVHSNGLVQASDRPLNSKDDPTHYDAVWVRDTLWAYLGLQAQHKTDLSKKVLLKMLEYFSSHDQLKRLALVITNPKIVNSPNGAMEVLHIRFDGESNAFQDVQINGRSQKWNHKQNDALGLFYDLILKALQKGTIKIDELSSENYIVLASMPVYFSQIKYYEMEDAGSWEEIEKVATSSIGLVTSSLERLLKILKSNEPGDIKLAAKIKGAATKLNLDHYLNINQLNDAVSKGYDRIERQLRAGGESPLYKNNDPRRRNGDAALLNLIYPAELSKLTNLQKIQILNLVSPLVGEAGIKRYEGDSYQSGNFWFQTKANTEDNSSAQDFTSRGKALIPHSEAQWFFDSWFSKCAGLLFYETRDTTLRSMQVLHFNRALAQLTGGSRLKKYLSADGAPVAPFSLPESYNVIVLGNSWEFAPSPITPLNWSKASLAIALDQMKVIE